MASLEGRVDLEALERFCYNLFKKQNNLEKKNNLELVTLGVSVLAA
jgi:hypothetical protein